MAWLNRDQAKDIVCEALSEIADFSGDCESFSISQIEDVYKPPFINAVRQGMVDRGYDINLSISGDTSGLNNMESIQDLVDYVFQNQQREA